MKAVANPPGLDADEAEVYCANTHHSQTTPVENCLKWMLWLRIGEYTFFIGLIRDSGTSLEEFTAIALAELRRIDSLIAA